MYKEELEIPLYNVCQVKSRFSHAILQLTYPFSCMLNLKMGKDFRRLVLNESVFQ